MGDGDEWDEAVWLTLPDSAVLVHRVRRFGFMLGEDARGPTQANIAGHPTERYHSVNSDEAVQEEDIYAVERDGIVWEIRARITLSSDDSGYSERPADAVTRIQNSLAEVISTIRLH
jgi:hypothetical protein